MDREKKPKKEKWKIIGASAALLFMLPGVYFAAIRYIGSKKIALTLLVAAALAVAVVVMVGALLRQKDKRDRFLKAVTLVLAVGLGLINLGTLISPYFIAHNTTTIQNRYYPDSLAYMARLQAVTKDRIVWVDETNDYLKSDSKKDTATDFSNRAAVHYACAEIKTLNPSPGVLSMTKERWLKALPGGYDKFVIKYDKGLVQDREETAYVYRGSEMSDSGDMVFLWGESGDAYWVPMAVFAQMMGDTDE